MGGLSFTKPAADGSPALSVPRMKPELYIQLRDRYQAILKTLFAKVLCPLEAPSKLDHGDIDYIVFNPLKSPAWTTQEIAAKLEAVRFEARAHQNMSFAVPRYREAVPGDGEDSSTFTQLDVEIVDTIERYRWQAFKKSYGDLWTILGVIIRPFGLTADENGLQLRVKELEQGGFSKRASRIFLTSDADATMRFLRLDPVRYANGFCSETEVFEWLRSTYLFHPSQFASKENENVSDRHNRKKRPMFRRFREECLESMDVEASRLHSPSQPTRESVLRQVLNTFPVGEVHEAKLAKAKQQFQDRALKKRLVEILSNKFNEQEVELIVRAWSRTNSEQDLTNNNFISSTGTESHTNETIALEWIEAHVEEILNKKKAME